MNKYDGILVTIYDENDNTNKDIMILIDNKNKFLEAYNNKKRYYSEVIIGTCPCNMRKISVLLFYDNQNSPIITILEDNVINTYKLVAIKN